MATLSTEQIAAAAAQAGIPAAEVPRAVAIALAESGGNPNAYNGVGRDNSYGLWQINMLGAMGPERRRALGITTNAELFNPSVNARAMAMISSNGTNWAPWTTYTSGRYLLFMGRAQAGSGTVVQTANPLDQISNLSKAIDTLMNPGTWLRLGIFVGGAVLLLVALGSMIGSTTGINVRSLTKVAKVVATKGAVK